MILLSLLIPTLPERQSFLKYLVDDLQAQIKSHINEIEILIDTRTELSIGAKRNSLLQSASGEYIAFIDDDDKVSHEYISCIIFALKHNPDCVSLRGVMTTNDENPEIFEHSLRYKSWRETANAIKYERFPNHLNTIRANIAKQFKFPETNYGEDHAWSTQINNSGLLKNEYYLDKILYYYKYRTVK